MEKALQVVGFRIGNETYGVRIASVREIVRVPEITAVPSAPELIEGVINLRGKIIPVMDLRKRFGQTQIQPDKKNRILVVELENKLIGLIVNTATEVLKIPPSEIEAPGSVFAEGESGYVTGVGKLDRKSTRLNSSHPSISYAVFCLKKKKKTTINTNDSCAPPSNR